MRVHYRRLARNTRVLLCALALHESPVHAPEGGRHKMATVGLGGAPVWAGAPAVPGRRCRQRSSAGSRRGHRRTRCTWQARAADNLALPSDFTPNAVTESFFHTLQTVLATKLSPLPILVFNRLIPLVSRGAPGSCPSSLRSVDTGAVLRIRWASAVAGVVCPCVRSAGVPPPGGMRRDAPEKSRR
jgi:hypothetical protein